MGVSKREEGLSKLRIEQVSAEGAGRVRGELVAVHVDARAELIGPGFYSAERFGERLDRCFGAPGFRLVTGRVGDRLVGYAFGSPLPALTGWWDSVTPTDPATAAELMRETGRRTFAFREILVRKGDQGRGYAHRLHDALLGERNEERAVLLVRPDNPARELYRRWGWSVVGVAQPYDDGPRFEAMTIRLPLADET